MADGCEVIDTDVLVVGSGAAALRAVLEADAAGAAVLAVIKGEFRRSGATFHSVAEVGAFNVPDDAGHVGDNPDLFLDDILGAAQGMANPRLSKIVANEAAEALSFLERHGVVFEKQGGDYLVFRACFSSRPRSHVIKDHFKPIVRALGAEATRRGIRVRDRLMVTDLVVRDGCCHGARAIGFDGAPVIIRAKATILTTGGASQLFATNLYPSDITGDGYAMAHRAGARLVNMEFMQAGVSVVAPFVNLFGNYLWAGRPRLTDRSGAEFIADYLPRGISVDAVIATKERHFPFSASDISRYVEIAIQTAINEGRGGEAGGVYMDFVGRDFSDLLANPTSSMARMWPVTRDWYLQKGIDLHLDRIEIACSAHAINGGILIDENGESSLDGLFAAGEVAGGPHGADRLGGNMAVTCQIFGRRAGIAAARRAAAVDHVDVAGEAEAHLQALGRLRRDGPLDLALLRVALQNAANRHLLVVRTADGLSRFAAVCREVRHSLREGAAVRDSRDLVAAHELDNLCDVGLMIATAATLRRESRGGHYREDHPEPDDGQAQSIIFDGAHPDGYFRSSLADLGQVAAA